MCRSMVVAMRHVGATRSMADRSRFPDRLAVGAGDPAFFGG